MIPKSRNKNTCYLQGRPTEDEIAGPCVVILDKDTAFLQGGGDGSGGNNRTAYCESYFLDLNTKQWTPGPNITKCRHYHTCSLITNDATGHREIVVVGGWDELEKAIDEVEIIDLDTLQVRNGRWDSDLCITSFLK